MELKDLEAQYKALWEEIEKLKSDKIDFSKYVRVDCEVIAIMWNKMLKTFDDWDIKYNNWGRNDFTTSSKYTLTTLSELKVGDVFIRKQDVKNMVLGDFCIFMWEDRVWYYIFQFLENTEWIEVINRECYKDSKLEVYKFLRD